MNHTHTTALEAATCDDCTSDARALEYGGDENWLSKEGVTDLLTWFLLLTAGYALMWVIA